MGREVDDTVCQPVRKIIEETIKVLSITVIVYGYGHEEGFSASVEVAATHGLVKKRDVVEF